MDLGWFVSDAPKTAEFREASKDHANEAFSLFSKQDGSVFLGPDLEMNIAPVRS